MVSFLGKWLLSCPHLGISWQTPRYTRRTDKHRHKRKGHPVPLFIDLGTGAATPSHPPRPNQTHPKTDLQRETATRNRENRP